LLLHLGLEEGEHVPLGWGNLVKVLLLIRVDWRLQRVNEDQHLHEEGFPEQVVLELQVEERVARQILRVLGQYLSVVLVHVEQGLTLEALVDLFDSADDLSQIAFS
jgi:hypothetical protein